VVVVLGVFERFEEGVEARQSAVRCCDERRPDLAIVLLSNMPNLLPCRLRANLTLPIREGVPTTQDLADRRAGRPELPLSEVHCSGHFQSLRRIVRGLDPVHLLKARENAAGSENPTR
jgi:hypothetical protein